MGHQTNHNKTLDEGLKELNDSFSPKVIHTIQLNLPGPEKVYNEYSTSKNLRINDDILSLLKREIKYIPTKLKLTVEIKTPLGHENLLPHFEKTLKNNILQDIKGFKIQLKQKLKIVLILTLMGLLFLSILAFVAEMPSRFALNEILVIISWVFIWRAVEVYFFDRQQIKFQKLKWRQLYSARFVLMEEKRKNQ